LGCPSIREDFSPLLIGKCGAWLAEVGKIGQRFPSNTVLQLGRKPAPYA
jgi:hypothetical protein